MVCSGAKPDPCEARALAERLFRITAWETLPRLCAFRVAARLKRRVFRKGRWFPPYTLGNTASPHD